MNRSEELTEAILKLNDTLALQPTDWSSWALVVITLVYVIATFFICWFTCRSAKAMQEQTKELQRQFDETNRPNIDVTLHVTGKWEACLKIENTGKKLAKNVRIGMNDNFIYFARNVRVEEKWEKIQRQFWGLDTAGKALVNLNNSGFTMGVGQSWLVFMLFLPDFQKIAELDIPSLEISISYEDERKKAYSKKTIIDFTQYGWLMLHDASLADIEEELETIATNIDERLRKIAEALERCQHC